MRRVAILGAGTAGTMMAHRLRRRLNPNVWSITVIDKDQLHLYQPGLLFLPFGDSRPEDLVRPRQHFLPSGVDLCLDPVDRVIPEESAIRFENGDRLPYDILIVATGTRTDPGALPGLTEAGWMTSAFDFYTLEGATALGRALSSFSSGRLVINITDFPIKCPVAPLELAFLADAYFVKRGIRDAVEIVYATPLDGAFTKPRASAMLSHLLHDKNVGMEANFAVERIDGTRRVMTSYDGREIDYDLLVNVPLHRGSSVVERSGMGDESGFVPTDPHTLQSRNHPNVFAIGDGTDLPSSKAGSVAHFQSEILTENVIDFVEDRPMSHRFDGHSNCFIETGFDKAMLIDFNYETEPLPGRFPLPGIGPFTLLEESHVNHWGKLGFRWVYWNVLLAGKDLPMGPEMVLAGKWR